ncbi:hypothetical protein H6G83_28935 [Anabaena azotica FACHB-119]|uniref:Uncharacterized protein n=2 Tax=Anabaena azotica TaxID=197653 RepID=A0ABR8DC99_9NOST|nr:hypothetical protein [Anabaena azotica FACHB-119]
MDIQNILNIAIQVIVMGFVSLMLFDFADRLWGVPMPPASWQPPVIEPATAPQPNPQQEIPQLSPASAPQFEEIPDPWLEPAPVNTVSAQSVIVPFPTLRLLPPAKVQPSKPKRKRAKSSSKSPKSPKSPKSASTPKRQSTKTRTLTA